MVFGVKALVICSDRELINVDGCVEGGLTLAVDVFIVETAAEFSVDVSGLFWCWPMR